MLIQNILPGCIEASCATSLSSQITKQDSCDLVSGSESLEMSKKNDKSPLDDSRKFNSKDDGPCSLNIIDGSRASSFSAKSGSSKPVVYHRKRFRRNPLTTFYVETSAEVRPSNGCPSELCSEVHSGTFKEDLVAQVPVEKLATAAPILVPAESNKGSILSKSSSCDGSSGKEGQCAEEASRSELRRASEFCVNDSYSSSMFDLDIDTSSLKTDMDDAAECSSSDALGPEGLDDHMREKDICIAILRRHGLLEKVLTEIHTSTEAFETSCDNCCLISCKACDRLETTLKMLICDKCNDAYHLSCCNPRIRKIPRDEWLCRSCLIKKRKLLEKATRKSLSVCVETEGSSNLFSDGESGSGIYRTCVRIGNSFQAEVPDWTGPMISEVDHSGEPLDIRPSDYLSLHHGCSSNKPSRISSIGNWLQCRQVVEGIGECLDGNICGKWRRAPLFEVQTEDWECFSAIHWDPAHADCAVPQELETEEVLKQLKYIEMLKPRLAVKRRKLGQTSVVTQGASKRMGKM